MQKWQYGQEKYHHIKIEHPFSKAAQPKLREQLDAGPVPRGGSGVTPSATSDNYNQRTGATFRIISDVGNWDNSLGTNTPGQSGDPENPHYKDLFELWSKEKYFPVLYTREKIVSAAETITVLRPEN